MESPDTSGAEKGGACVPVRGLYREAGFHENLSVEEAVQRACEWLEQFRQMQIDTKSERATVLVSKKGKVTVKRKKSAGRIPGNRIFPTTGRSSIFSGRDGYSVFKGSGRDDTGWQDCSFPV